MTKIAKRTTKDKGKTYVRALGDGLKLEAQVSPCVFMYPSYPLQITVTLRRHPDECLGEAYAVDRTKTAATYTSRTIERLLAGIRTVLCPRCSTPAFDPATIQTNRRGLCEACFFGDLNAEYAAAEEADQQKFAAYDRQMKGKGMLVRISAWVHPQDGDDYRVAWYLNVHPTPEHIADLLRGQGSSCLDDYQTIIL